MLYSRYLVLIMVLGRRYYQPHLKDEGPETYLFEHSTGTCHVPDTELDSVGIALRESDVGLCPPRGQTVCRGCVCDYSCVRC